MLLATARAMFDLQAVLFYLQKLRGEVKNLAAL
jgi:hypothetical protein